MNLQMILNAKPVCKYFIANFVGEINCILCSNGKQDFRHGHKDKEKHDNLFIYSCCSEVGCRKCLGYKQLKGEFRNE